MQIMDAMAPFIQSGIVNIAKLAEYVLQYGFGVKQPSMFIQAPPPPPEPMGPEGPMGGPEEMMPPQGMPPMPPEGGMPPQGMPPQGMPPELAGLPPELLMQLMQGGGMPQGMPPGMPPGM
jgi:hypothetical protein